MFSQLSDLKKASLFILIVFGLVATIIILPFEHSTSLFMFVPLVSVLLTMGMTGEAFNKAGWKQLGFRRFKWKMLAVAFFIPIIPILLGYMIVWATGLGTLELADEYKGEELLVIVNFITSAVVASLTVTLGEEIGWRGYLSSKLQSLGMAKATLLNGFIWGLFHLPIIMFTDVYHDGVNLYVFIPLFMATVTLAGAFMTYVRYASGSIWLAIIAHSFHNQAWRYGEMFTQEPDDLVTYITGDAGVVLIVFYLIVFGFIMKRYRQNRSPLQQGANL